MVRTVLVTGASSGLGAALALEHASAGATLLLIGRDPERLAATGASCCARGARCQLEALDVRDTSRLLEVLDRWDDAFPIDLAVLNAGVVAGRQDGAEGERANEILAQVDTNLRATLIAANLLVARMCKRRRGQLAVVSSLNALYPVPEAPTYCATKAALAAYVEATRTWASHFGVRVSLILPGFIQTGFTERYEGPRPLEVSAQVAARRIHQGLKRGRETIAFPLVLRALIALGGLVPRRLHRLVLREYAAKLDPLADQSDFSKIR